MSYNNYNNYHQNSTVTIDEDDTVFATPLQVVVHNENYDKAFKAFKTLVQKDGKLALWKECSLYEKPSDRKRRKRNEARRMRAAEEGKIVKKALSSRQKKKLLKKKKAQEDMLAQQRDERFLSSES